MTKTVLELINEAFSAPDPDADASGYGFDSEFNEPVNAADSNHSMEPENIAAVYFTESDKEEFGDGGTVDPETGEELLFDYEASEMISPEASQDLAAYFNEDMVDISTISKEMDGEIPPGGVMDEQGFKEPKDMGPSQLGLDKNMSVQKAMNKRIEEESIGLAESLVLSSLK